MLSAFEELSLTAPKFNGRLTLMAVGGEERSGTGTKIAMKRGYRAETAILGSEPADLDPKIAHKSVLRVEVTVKGNTSHASMPEEGVNAIYYMVRLTPKLEKFVFTVGKEFDPFTGHTSMAITMIKRGATLNMIPDTCSIPIDRSMPPVKKRGNNGPD